MKIKLAILESDVSYLKRIVSVFNTKFVDRLEIYSFTDKEVALSILEKKRINVLLASDVFEIEEVEIPKQCAFAYFVDSSEIDSVNGQKAICKFQKAETIYRDILGIYAENSGNTATFKMMDGTCKVLMFSSPAGGVGNSTMAAAFSVCCAKRGKKVLYLNLEKLGSADAFFSADGSLTMSDVLYALKGKKTKLSFKIESCVKQDKSGVYFFSQTKFALDMAELSYEDWGQLINELRITGIYEFIIVDMDFVLDEEYLKLYEMANEVVWINSGTSITNGKTYRAFQACRMIEQDKHIHIIEKIVLAYNRFSNKFCKIIDGELGVESIGGAPNFINVSNEQIIEQLSDMEILEKLL